MRNRYAVEGLDQSEEMLAVAREHFPEIVFHPGDMRDFDLRRKFNVVVCLFSAIGYVKTPAGLRQAIANMSRHLLPGGILAVEPWLSKEKTRAGDVFALFVNQPTLKIARMDIPAVRDGVSVINFHCLVGTPERIEYFTETHELGLFSQQEYLEAFSAAGLEAFYDERGLMDRGLYLGRSSLRDRKKPRAQAQCPPPGLHALGARAQSRSYDLGRVIYKATLFVEPATTAVHRCDVGRRW